MHPKKFEKICLYCNKEYMSTTDKSRFCSNYCANTYRHKMVYVPKEIKYVTKICKMCGNEFQGESHKANQKYCSLECRQEHYKYYSHNKMTQKDEKNLEILQIQVELKVKELIAKSNKLSNDYNDTIIDYRLLSDIPLDTRNLVLDRDHNKCQICNSRNNLHIHHIVKRRNGGDHNPDNLVTLCASCHRHIEIGDIDYAMDKCFENAKRNYFNNGVVNTLERYEIIDKLSEIFNDVKTNYANCNNLLISINELIEQI